MRTRSNSTHLEVLTGMRTTAFFASLGTIQSLFAVNEKILQLKGFHQICVPHHTTIKKLNNNTIKIRVAWQEPWEAAWPHAFRRDLKRNDSEFKSGSDQRLYHRLLKWPTCLPPANWNCVILTSQVSSNRSFDKGNECHDNPCDSSLL